MAQPCQMSWIRVLAKPGSAHSVCIDQVQKSGTGCPNKLTLKTMNVSKIKQ